jgi:flagellar biosynthesis protein FliR
VISLLFVSGQLAVDLVSGISGGALRTKATNEMGRFPFLFMTVVFLSIQGHHQVIHSLMRSFTDFPIGSDILLAKPLPLILGDALQTSFLFGVQICFPIALSVVLANLAVAILARTVRELNMLSIGMGLNLAIVLAACFIFVGGMGIRFESQLENSLERIPPLFQRQFTIANDAQSQAVIIPTDVSKAPR